VGALLDSVMSSPDVAHQIAAAGLSSDVLSVIALDIGEDNELASARNRVHWELWDGTSPINGVSADVIRAQNDVVGEAYTVWVDGAVVIFQPHALGSGFLPLDPAAIRNQAAADANALINSIAYQAIMATVMARLAAVEAARGVVVTPLGPMDRASMTPQSVAGTQARGRLP
jgi:hypothetical protein